MVKASAYLGHHCLMYWWCWCIVMLHGQNYKNKKPSQCWDSQPSVGIFGNFFNFRQQHCNMVRREPASLFITLRQSLCLWRQYTLHTGLGSKRFIAIVFVTFRCRNIAKKTQIPLRISVKRQKESQLIQYHIIVYITILSLP